MRIRCKNDYLELLKKLKKEAREINGTYEFIGRTIEFVGNTAMVKSTFGITDDFEREFISAISKFEKKEIGPFLTEKYFLLLPGIKMAMGKLIRDCDETRRCVLNFPPEHCFQSVQFLLRDNTVHVVCYMRSCNAVKNLPYDMWLCAKMADIYAQTFMKMFPNKSRPYGYYSISMMFGSLHMFKEDSNYVL